ncbi:MULTISPECIES: flagellar hook protein FlgE [Citrobacter]|jgi:flagellar hook protein FlgE|uniref:Flagellar hook protein FlgE n=2 Tax=Citrobacter freundii complex TaxID=1344959 RepID=A0AAE7GQY1_CITFR|nr:MULTISPECIES: flagellar hook protein FlgE [Citrobacter]MBA7728775.1 flagellar basal body protein FlgE [Citrobacter freundii]MBD0829573.1 flagellar basal body protein FlgE [Citrobacter sp. C1]NTZ49483.1 flagellar basal body protein FlaE [Citrobacter gillenii]QCA19725.1 flagellar basal body protein FlaE [Citrobacter freundii]QLO12819.1 flagellar basal body protein FlgE [Citrobacter freundii]
MSYEIAATGLNAVNEQLDGISNNIANSGTVGYKSMTTQFSAMYAGTQAMGVSVAGSAQSISTGGSMVSTGNALDLAINDDGFFVMCDSAGNISYTRAGSFVTDKNGYIVNASGDYLQGYPVDDSGTLQTGTVSDIQIQTGNIPAEASDSLSFTANFDASDATIDRSTVAFDPTNSASYSDSYTTTVYDSLGNEHSVCQYFTKTSDNTWEVDYTFDGAAQDGAAPTTLTFDPNTGKLTSPTTPQTVEFTTDAAAPIELTVDYSSCTQYGSDFSVTTNSANGYASATQNGVQVDDDGKVYATYSNGERMLQGQVVLATFPDENGLEAVSGTAWVQTGESGTPLIGTPGSGSCGTLSSGMLESSNVDITTELVDLMTAQRNYQANTKVISTSTQLDDALFQAM